MLNFGGSHVIVVSEPLFKIGEPGNDNNEWPLISFDLDLTFKTDPGYNGLGLYTLYITKYVIYLLFTASFCHREQIIGIATYV